MRQNSIHQFFQSIKILIIFSFLLFLTNCSQRNDKPYKVGVDPLWFSLDIAGQETILTMFTIELIDSVGKIEKKKIDIYLNNQDNLFYGLESGKYDAICTSKEPHIFYEKVYLFSDIFLNIGPVLVTKTNSPFQNLDLLEKKEVGYLSNFNGKDILNKHPQILQRPYDSLPKLLADTSYGYLDACLVDLLPARAYINDLFYNELKMSSKPLDQQGIRLIGLNNQSATLIKIFNEGLSQLKKKGKFTKILTKWHFFQEPEKKKK